MSAQGRDHAGRPGHRWLTLAPPAWSGYDGSRFSCLAGLTAEPSGDEDLDRDHIAVRSALIAMVGDGISAPVLPRPILTEEEIRQQFWEDAGFPTPASRFWERSTSQAAGEVSNGVSLCRLPSRAEPIASLRRRNRGACSSPSVLRISRPPSKMGPWRGPLPPRRSSPAPVLGTFIDRAMVVGARAASSAPLAVARPCAPSASSPGGVDHPSSSTRPVPEMPPTGTTVGRGISAFQIPDIVDGGTHSHALDPDHPSWEHLDRCFRKYWARVCPNPVSAAAASHLPPSELLRPCASPSSSSPTSAPPTFPSSPSSALLASRRWVRSFVDIVASTSPALMNAAPQHPPSGAGPWGVPVRPPLQQGPLAQPHGAMAGPVPGHGAPSAASVPACLPVPAPMMGAATFRPLQHPSRQYRPPAYLPPMLPFGQFQPPPMAAPMLPPYQQQQAPPQVAVAGQGVSQIKRKKKKSGQSVSQVAQQFASPQQFVPPMHASMMSGGQQQVMRPQGQQPGLQQQFQLQQTQTMVPPTLGSVSLFRQRYQLQLSPLTMLHRAKLNLRKLPSVGNVKSILMRPRTVWLSIIV